MDGYLFGWFKNGFLGFQGNILYKVIYRKLLCKLDISFGYV